MRIVSWIKKLHNKFSHWTDRTFGPDRLSFQPRIITAGDVDKDVLNELRKIYRTHQKTNIAVTGGKSVGKKSTVKTFEEERFFSFGKFIHVDFREFADLYLDTADSIILQTRVDAYLLDNITARAKQGELPGLNDQLVRGHERIYRRPLIDILLIGLIILILYSKDQLVGFICQYLPETWKSTDIGLAVGIVCVAIIVVSCLSLIRSAIAFWPFKWLKIKVAPKTPPVELSVEDNKTGAVENKNKTIYALKRLRWKIGHTVVFDNMDVLGEEVFLKLITHLCAFNRKTNEHITSWRLWKITPLKRPIRFIYTFRDDLVQFGLDKPLFDDVIYIPPTITAVNAFHELERSFNVEISKGVVFPVNKLFPVDPNYEANVSTYITDRRIINMTVKRTIQRYKDFEKRIQPILPTENDVRGLFSFVLYSLFFPKDSSKFADNTSIVLTNSSNRDDIIQPYLGLFEYLISEKCPSEYRISFLSLRFVGLQPELKDKHLAGYHKAYASKDYSTALRQIEKAICCTPNDERLIGLREDVLKAINDEKLT